MTLYLAIPAVVFVVSRTGELCSVLRAIVVSTGSENDEIFDRLTLILD